MRLAHDTHNFGQPPVGLLATWGLAAGAQTQISPGASALAAPHQQCYGLVPGGLAC